MSKFNSVKMIRMKNLGGLSALNKSYHKSKMNRAIFDVSNLRDFERKVKHCKTPVLVDFYASWCTPCKALAPRLVNIVSEQRGQLQLARVDIDELTDLALDYNVGSVPSLLVMHNGKVMNRLVGLQTSDYIRNWLAAVIKKCAPDHCFIHK